MTSVVARVAAYTDPCVALAFQRNPHLALAERCAGAGAVSRPSGQQPLSERNPEEQAA